MFRSGALVVVALVVALAAMACTPAGSVPSSDRPPTTGGGASISPPASPSVAPASPDDDPSSAPPSASLAAATPQPATPAAAGATVFTLVLSDGPRQGTWQVTHAANDVAACTHTPDRDAWTATYLGLPPLSFVDAQTGSDREPMFMVKFTDEPDELNFRPSGDVKFEADDRGEAATLTWTSATNQGSYFDSTGVKTGEVEVGSIELTIECGSIFTYQ